MQVSESRSASESAGPNANYKEVTDWVPCQPEHWNTTTFVGKIIFIEQGVL